jgi:hypothetical protein
MKHRSWTIQESDCDIAAPSGLEIAYIHHWVSGVASYKRSGIVDKKVEVLEFFSFLPSFSFLTITKEREERKP